MSSPETDRTKAGFDLEQIATVEVTCPSAQEYVLKQCTAREVLRPEDQRRGIPYRRAVRNNTDLAYGPATKLQIPLQEMNIWKLRLGRS